MQTLKEHVRVAILRSAEKQFSENGFAHAAMRDIASGAGITVGNLYVYFDNKEAIFSAVVEEAADRLNQIILTDMIFEDDESTGKSIAAMAKALLQVFSEHDSHFIMLLCGSDGTLYQDIRKQLCAVAAGRLEKELHERTPNKPCDKEFCSALAAAAVEGILHIAQTPGLSPEKTDKLFTDFLNILFLNIHRRY